MRAAPVFRNRLLPYLLVLPQLVLVGVFFFWPAGMALYQSVLRIDPFGIRSQFVGLANFTRLFHDPYYLGTVRISFVLAILISLSAMSLALLFAVMANKPLRGAKAFRTIFVWPYAVAPAVSAVLWAFIFQPEIGYLGRTLKSLGISWNPYLNSFHAQFLVVLIAAWKQISYNFVFFLAGLQSIPQSVLEAAAVDGASPRHIFWRIVFPLLSPTTFFLTIMNVNYSFFETFGVIDALTKGGPGKATETLVYRAYVDGRVNLNIGLSAAQSVVLLLIVVIITAFQFKYVERRVHYA